MALFGIIKGVSGRLYTFVDTKGAKHRAIVRIVPPTPLYDNARGTLREHLTGSYCVSSISNEIIVRKATGTDRKGPKRNRQTQK